MRTGIAILLLVFARPIGDGSPSRDTYGVHLLKGEAFYHSFDNRQALVEYEIAYAMAPDSFATIQRLVSIYNDMGRLKLHKDTSAETSYRLSLAYADSLNKYYPFRAESHFWIALNEGSLIPFGGVREKVGRAKKVLEEANRAVSLDSTFSLAYVILGIFQREAANTSWFERVLARIIFGADVSGSLEESELFLRKALYYNPSNSYAYFELYLTYKAMKDSDHAIESLQKLLTIAPTNAREQQQNEDAKRRLSLIEKNRE